MMFLYWVKTFRIVASHGKFWILYTVSISIVLGLLPVAMLWVTKELINELAMLIQMGTEQYGVVFRLLLVQFGITILNSVLTNWKEYLDHRLEIRLDHILQQEVLQKTTSVPVSYFDIPEFYNHLNRIQGSQGSRFLSPIRNLLLIGQTLITVFTLCAYLFSVHWSLVLLSLLSAVPILFVQSLFGRSKFRLMQHQTQNMRDVHYTGNLLLDRQAAKEVRLFGLAPHLIKRWSDKFQQNAILKIRWMRKHQTAKVSLDSLTALVYAGAAYILIGLTRTGAVQIGDFIAIGQAAQGTQSGINQISNQIARMYEEYLYIRDYFTFLEFEQDEGSISKGSQAFPAPLVRGIVLDSVCFCYPGSTKQVLDQVSFSIVPGEKIAIVGENGSGKTTLVKCIMGLYPVSEGKIRFDDVLLEEMDTEELVRNITVIFQDFMRYSYSLYDNIAFGNIARFTDHTRVREVAAACGVESFAGNMPAGYDTYLGRFLQNGEDLSGGQWQKVALSRAMFRGGSIMILDEPTAALDPLAELEVFQQFEKLSAGKTTIFISHRMSAARMADRIVVMKDGSVVEMGTHDELIELAGEYSRMYQMQAKWYS